MQSDQEILQRIHGVNHRAEISADLPMRTWVYVWLFDTHREGNLQKSVDRWIGALIVANLFALMLEHVPAVYQPYSSWFHYFDLVSVAVFTAEYLLRLYVAPEDPEFARGRNPHLSYMRSPFAVIDLLAILPFFLEVFLHHLFDLRFLRVFRLLRLFKLTRYTGATKTLTTVVMREWPVLAASAFVMLLLVILTASLGYLFEHEAQPDKFENIPQSIYWAVITLASVGYGDISPVTPMGRMMTIVLALLGIGIFAIPAALLSSAFTDQLRIERETLKNELYEMLADGHLSEDEADKINQEAKRLHLSEDEVQRLIIKAKRERELKEDVSMLPLHKIAANTPHAIEYYRWTLSNLRQIGILGSTAEFEKLAESERRLTPEELLIWRAIQGHPASGAD